MEEEKVISKLLHSDKDVAQNIYLLFQESYAVEAEILNAIDFPPLKRQVDQFIHCENTFYGCSIQHELAAVVEIKKEEETIHIQSLVVKPAHFRQGIAQQLMSYIFNTYQAERYTVETGLANEPAVTLYLKLGFIEIDQWDTDHNVRKVRFEKCSN